MAIRPPGPRPISKTVTSNFPFSCKSLATVEPEMPAPITATRCRNAIIMIVRQALMLMATQCAQALPQAVSGPIATSNLSQSWPSRHRSSSDTLPGPARAWSR